MKMYGGEEAQLHTFLTVMLDRDEWSASLPEKEASILVC
jgi:hypothetical protein